MRFQTRLTSFLFLSFSFFLVLVGVSPAEAKAADTVVWAGGEQLLHRLSMTGGDLNMDDLSPEPSIAEHAVPGRVLAVAVDPVEEGAVVLTTRALHFFDREGLPAGEWQLSSLDGPRASHQRQQKELSGFVRLVESDGSLWIARGHRLEAFGQGGELFFREDLETSIAGLEVDVENRSFWLATGTQVESRDLVSGYLLERRELSLGELRATTITVARDLWVAGTEGLLRLDATGQELVRTATTEPTVALAPRGLGVWAAGGPSLRALGGKGEELLTLDPFPRSSAKKRLENELQAIEPAIGGGVWVTDGRQVQRLDSHGLVLDSIDLSARGAVNALALTIASNRGTPPALEILYPHEGERVRSQRPVFEIEWSDDKGVDASTLGLEVNGSPLGLSCRESITGASCSLQEDLPLGRITVTAFVENASGLRSEPAIVSFEVAALVKASQAGSSEAGSSETASSETVSSKAASSEKLLVDPNIIPYTPVASPRGIRPNTPFLSPTDIETIDPNSGNLTLRVPLGPSFSVGPLINYQLQAVHNSKAWDHIDAGCPPGGCPQPLLPITASVPNRGSNAGLGWEVHLGRLYSPDLPLNLPAGPERALYPNHQSAADSIDRGSRWMYVAPDGAVHYLYQLPNRPAGFYSKDGSFLRLIEKDATTRELSFRDGRVATFKREDSFLGTDFCGNGVSRCWRYQETRDPYGNKQWVDYEYDNGGTEEVWTVMDSVRNTPDLGQRLVFDITASGTARGDGHPNGNLTRSNGDEWGDLRRVLKRVETIGFENHRARFEFDTNPVSVRRGCPHDERSELQGVDYRMRVPILNQIQVLNEAGTASLTQPWKFVTADGGFGAACGSQTGRITKVTAPSRGSIAYTYNWWREPSRCVYTRPTDGRVLDELDFEVRGIGLSTRKTLDAGGNTVGRWTYVTHLYPTIDQMIAELPDSVPPELRTVDAVLYGQHCRRAEYRKTVVKEPADDDFYTRREYFSSVAEGERTPSATTTLEESQVTDRGLPFSKSIRIPNTDGANGLYRFLSERVAECPVSGSCVIKRRQWVRYLSEFRDSCRKGLDDSPGCYQINPVLRAARTEFVDDGGRYIDRRNLSYNGVGEFRRMEIKDTFSGPVKTRIETTNYNSTGATALSINSTTGYLSPGNPAGYLPAPGEPWILRGYTYKQVEEDNRTYLEQFRFDGKGSIECIRKRKSAQAPTSDDQVVRITYGQVAGLNAGLPTEEIVAGGDDSGLGNGICSTNGSGPGARFRINHSYQHSALSKTQIGSFPTWYNANIDRASGLPLATINPAGQNTQYSFDPLGRLTGIFPKGGLGEADTRITYENTPNLDPKVITKRRVNGGPVLTQTDIFYDFLARPYREVQERPTASGSAQRYSEVRKGYDIVGRLSYESTRQVKGNVNITDKATLYGNYDVFGRPRRVTRPDGTVERLSYLGERWLQSTVDVMTPTGLAPSATTTIRDSQGRVIQVSNPVFNTSSTYDPHGNRLSVRRFKGGNTQTRTYGYDGRGFLVSENLPEIDGVVQYKFNALGQVKQASGPRNLTFDYDGAGRKLRLKETGSGRLWKEWRWGTTNGTTSNGEMDYRVGKVVEAIRHNYPMPGAGSWAVAETYEYGTSLGLMSRKTTQLQWPDNPPGDRYGALFAQSFEADALGNQTSMTYPRCETPSYCAGANDAVVPPHSVDSTYESGLPWAVQSSFGPAGTYSYHPNLQIASLTYSNGVLGTFAQGTDGMVRARNRSFSKGNSIFSTGTYSYDGAGNISAIGNDESYFYDKAGRLLRGEIRRHPFNVWEEYTYDIFDNMTTLTQSSGYAPVYNVSSQSNRLLGNNDIDYDLSGNMLAIAEVGNPALPKYEMDYDLLNMMQEFTSRDPNAPEHHRYLYGPGDLRLIDLDDTHAPSSPAVRTYTFRSAGGTILSEFTVTGWGDSGANPESWVWEKDFVYASDGLLATVSKTGEQRFFHADHLGTPRAITNGLGTRIGRHDYYPFGRELYRPGQADEIKYKFTGHEREPHGLSDYMRGRYYFHPFQRFSSVDPARDGWNLYSYVGNNPINIIDPSGQSGVKYVIRLAGGGYRFVKRSVAVRKARTLQHGVEVVGKGSSGKAKGIVKEAFPKDKVIRHDAHRAGSSSHHQSKKTRGVGQVHYGKVSSVVGAVAGIGGALGAEAEELTGSELLGDATELVVDFFNPAQDILEAADLLEEIGTDIIEYSYDVDLDEQAFESDK